VFLDRQLAKKVPELTVYFWIIKVLTTGMGETTSDFFVHTYNPYLVVVLGAASLGIALVGQLYLRRYHPSVYWLSVSMVAVFGTMAAGNTACVLGRPVHTLGDQLCRQRDRHLRVVVSQREDPLGPQHLHAPP
jgi:uncharacterized membrane-anchored protein